MSAHDNGGPAFPADVMTGGISLDAATGQNTYDTMPHAGMTLRDYFAAKALPGVMRMIGEGQHEPAIDLLPISNVDFIAHSAYELADAMLKARQS